MCEQILLTVIEAARRLSLGRSLTYRYIQTGELRSVKVGGARRVLVTDLQEFVRRLQEASVDV
jgi:excisionase family DNA binding protein